MQMFNRLRKRRGWTAMSAALLLFLGSPALAAETYEIQAAGNDEIFVINDEKFEAKTYCLGWEEGNEVKKAVQMVLVSVLNFITLAKEETCEVWCQ